MRTRRMWTSALGLVAGLSLSSVAMSRTSEVWMNLFILTADLSQVEETSLDRFVELGATGIEFPGTTARIEDCERLGRYVRDRGIGAALNVAVDAEHDPSALDATARAKGVRYLKEKVDCAAAIGAKTVAGPIVLPWGSWEKRDSGKTLRDLLETKKQVSLPAIREVADYAAAKGIRLAYEPLTRWEMPGLNTLGETIRYIKELGHPNFGVTLDPSHEVMDGEGPKKFAEQVAWLAANDRLFYVQVSAPHRGDLVDSWLPWQDFLKPLAGVWQGPLAIEIMNAVPPFAAPAGGGLRLVRAPFADPFVTAARAMRLTKAEWLKAQGN